MESVSLLAAADQPYGMIWQLMGLLVVGLAAVNWTSRAGTIARGTLKEAVRQPAFVLTLTFTILFLIALKYIPFFAGKDETKFYIECCLATILMSGMCLGVWLASTSVADEIEGKTAMTLLSKPINRRQFVLGKYLGILQALLILVFVSGVLLYFFTYEKVGYDARESSSGRLEFVFWTKLSWLPFEVPTAVPQRWEMAIRVIPGLMLIFMEIAVVTAISVAISTRVPMLVNVMTCLSIFVVGHLTTVLVQSTLKDQVFVTFIARLLATVLPTLESFNMDAAIATGRTIPPEYIGWSAVYSVSYIFAAILLGFILFEDRDLA
jgi:ABC-type transport system involved in multi-copper enzyme maturation permease subunit